MKVVYETETCKRCGGSGNYSYNHLDGTRCYGCGGSGKKLTKRGHAAKEYADALLVVRIEDYAANHNGRPALDRGRRFCFAQETDTPVAWRLTTDSQEPIRGFTLMDADGQKVGTLCERLWVRLVPTDTELTQIVAYQDSLTKAGKPRKRA